MRTAPDSTPDASLDREFAAVIFSWESAVVPDRRHDVRAIRRRVAALCAAGVHVVVISEADLGSVDAQLRTRPDGPGRMLLSVGRGCGLFEVDMNGPRPLRRRQATGDAALRDAALRDTDAMREVLTELAAVGVGPGLVLVLASEFGGRDSRLLVPEAARCTVVSVGAEPAGRLHHPGGPAAVRALVDAVLARRREHRVPTVDDDPHWVVRENGPDARRRRVSAALFTLGAGGFGTRGSVEEEPPGSVPLVLAAGVYEGAGAEQHLQPAPGWTRVGIDPPPSTDRRLLDLRTGLLLREETGPARVALRSARFASAQLPGVMLMRVEAGDGRLSPGPPLNGGHKDLTIGDRGYASVAGVDGTTVTAAAAQRTYRGSGRQVVERAAAYAVGGGQTEARKAAGQLLDAAEEHGFDRALAEHRARWARRWDEVDVRIPDDASAELAVRYALFQLWSHANDAQELALGARGLTGDGYAGHVFWDADVFVLPAMVSIDPAAARAMVTYRLRRLSQARRNAHRQGRRGARYPWESAATGEDVTPAVGLLSGRAVPILTGVREEHVTADVAWAIVFRAEWSATRLTVPEQTLLVDTAEYWASRCRGDGHG